jgi:hypothetical protein
VEPGRCADEPECNGQFLATITQMEQVLFLLYIMQNNFHFWHIPFMCHALLQSLKFCMDFKHARMVLIIYHKCMHLIIHFNPIAT